jgi:hypothetical protein
VVEVLYPSSWDLLFLDYDDLLLYQASCCLSLLDDEDGEMMGRMLVHLHRVQVDHPSFLYVEDLVRLDPFDRQAQSFVVS